MLNLQAKKQTNLAKQQGQNSTTATTGRIIKTENFNPQSTKEPPQQNLKLPTTNWQPRIESLNKTMENTKPGGHRRQEEEAPRAYLRRTSVPKRNFN